jgi:hypothetical protein
VIAGVSYVVGKFRIINVEFSTQTTYRKIGTPPSDLSPRYSAPFQGTRLHSQGLIFDSDRLSMEGSYELVNWQGRLRDEFEITQNHLVKQRSQVTCSV